MTKIISLLTVALFFVVSIASAVASTSLKKDISFYLPNEQFDKNVPTPESILGYQVGEWHVRHDQLVSYYKALAAASDRVSVKTIGFSHQHRELLHVTITHPNRHQELEKLKQQRSRYFYNNEKNESNSQSAPLIVNLNYSVHGDESSGSNASLLVAYYLAASNSKQVQAYLNDMIIIIDPSLNPDGLSRFALWANQHKGKNINKDPNNREHIQGWIRGRVNQYWFDLNRDWLLLQHPESQARIAEYQQWRPHVLTDHHEMGTNSSFFFQPGIPSRKNPLTPDKNVSLTKELATYHAKAFDEANKLYFTEEAFDDFYAGKGSTYPDLHGSIGILFEQASSRGHIQESINGDLDFPTTVKHQVMSTFSTLEGSLNNADKLKAFQDEFKDSVKKLVKSANYDGYLLTETHDKTRFNKLLSLLKQHNINAYPLREDTKLNDKLVSKADSVFIPLNQPQVRLIQSVFSTQTSFNDNTFYDVSSWNLAYAFNIEFEKVKSARKLKLEKTAWRQPLQNMNADKELPSNAYSIAIDWHDFNAPALVYHLLNDGIKVRSALKTFSADAQVKGKFQNKQFAAGTMLIHAGIQTQGWQKKLAAALVKFPVPTYAIKSGLTASGIDLGSRLMMPVTLPKVLLVGGPGTNLYEVGETWYLLDSHVGFSPTIVEKSRLPYVDLTEYTHVVLTDGSYSKKDESLADDLKEFAKQGGIIWGQKRAALWLAQQSLLRVDTISQSEMFKRFNAEELVFSDKEALGGKQRVAGAFFEAKLDLSHPLTFGLSNETIPLFKNRTDLMLETKVPFSGVASYTETPLLSGYADNTNVEKIAGASSLVSQTMGRGVVIGMTDNPNFRAIMYGSSRLFVNILFLAPAVRY
ncbi:M14 family metallopeptidase [Psychrosphaera aestuarii]|uniref:M14 family metallopeptidase n=1 Tax=Psychrosphaera aestuarii TaxID=1266052 RepID=UPI001B32BA38|nr:M14 family metallopeptidase [Psychrosphaera aestuarii]